RSRSGSPRSGPGSPRSRSGSPRSGPGSPRSRSGSPKSGSGSPRRERSPGSDSDGSVVQRKKQRLVSDSESDAEKQPDITATADDLFGDDLDDISSASEHESDKQDDDNQQAPMIDDEDGEGEQQPEEPIEVKIPVDIPKIKTDLGKQIHFVKLPNFLSVETRPFDAAIYEDEIDEDEVLDEEGRTRMKLKVENTIRWRDKKDAEGNQILDEEGNPVRESNARMIRWSDGSMSLHLGVEVFDVHPMNLHGDYNHLFIRQGTGLQGQAVFKTKLTFRPHSTDSFTHRKMTMSLADRSTKANKLKVIPISGLDPNANRNEMIKKEEEKLKATIRRESQQRRIRDRAHNKGLSSSYLEDDEENEAGISLSAIKNAYKPNKKSGKDRMNIYSSDSEESLDDEVEERRERRLMKAKKIMDSDDEESDQESSKKKARIYSDSDEEANADRGGSENEAGTGNEAQNHNEAGSGEESD
ncbi:unnamed protein product, partial [Owenia fusiformis]